MSWGSQSPRDLSGHGKNATEWKVLTSVDHRGRGASGHGKEVSLRGARMNWGLQREDGAASVATWRLGGSGNGGGNGNGGGDGSDDGEWQQRRQR